MKIFLFINQSAKALLLTVFMSMSALSQAQDPIFVRLFVHIVEDDDGTGGVTLAQAEETVSILNEAFNPHDIYFIRDCASYEVHNTTYNQNGFYALCDIMADYPTNVPPYNTGINIFIVKDFSGGAGGRAEFIPSNTIVIGGFANSDMIPYSRSIVIAHEVGHCLGLLHTFFGDNGGDTYATGCAGNTGVDPTPCKELVNGDAWNRTNCGDNIADTPADPRVQNDVVPAPICEYIGMEQDPEGDIYDPDVGNIMSYARIRCRDHFSTIQVKEMKGFLDTDPVLTPTVVQEETIIDISTSFSGASCPASQFEVTYDVCLLGTPIGPVAVNLSVAPTQGVDFGGDFTNNMASTTLSTGCNIVTLAVTNNSVPLGDIFPIQLTASSNPGLLVNVEGCGLLEITSGTLPAFFDYEYGGACQVQFTSDFSGGSHFWDFGDGNTSTEENPLHQYLNASPVFVVTHSVTTPCGMTTSTEVVLVACSTFFDCSCNPFQDYHFGIPATTTRLSQYPNTPSTLSGCIAIAGNFIIDEPLTFDLAEVFMQPGASIEIEESTVPSVTNKLTILESTLKGCGTEMWQGIVVNGNTVLTSGESSRIEDALYAVTARENATVDITSTTFDRNRVGIFSENPFTLTPLYDVVFDCSGFLSSPLGGLRSEAGIMVSNGGLLSIGVNGQGAVVFHNLSNGILANNNSLMVQNATFIDLDPKGDTYQFNGFGIRADNAPLSPHTLQQTGGGMAGDPSFVNCRTGIKAIGTSVDISGNIMENVRIGVSTEFCPIDTDIYDNDIVARAVGIEVSQSNPNATRKVHDNQVTMTGINGNGIEINESLIDIAGATGLVEDNTIDLNGFGPGSGLVATGTGIELVSVAGMNVSGNTISIGPAVNNATGISVDGCMGGIMEQNEVYGATINQNRGIWAFSSPEILWDCNKAQELNTGFQVDMPSLSLDGYRGNRMDNAQTGLLLRPGARISEQDQTGNQWSNSGANGTLAVHEGDFDDIQTSLIFAEEPPIGLSSVFWPEQIQSASNWFFNEMAQNGEPYICLQEVPPVRLKSFAEDNIANFGGALDEPVEWLSAAYLYRRVNEHLGLLNEPGYTSFYNQNTGSTVGQFIAMENSTESIFEIGAADLSTLNGNNSMLGTKVAGIRSMETQIATASENDLAGLMAARAALYGDVANIGTASTNVWDQVQSQRSADAVQVISQNTGIATAYGFEANEKAVNDILLQTVAMGDIAYSGAQSATLENIAKQCPLQGGNAVFRARALLAGTVDSVFYDNAALCGSPSQLAKPPIAGAVTQSSFGLFPNPAKGQFTVQWDGNQYAGIGVDIVLYDLFGHRVLHRSASPKAGRATLSTGHLASGVYMCKVFAGKENALTENLVLIK